MKRNLLDITNKLYRTPVSVRLTPLDLTDSTYWIYLAEGLNPTSTLREITNDVTDKTVITLNNQEIAKKDYVLEQTGLGLNVKFIKNNFAFSLDENDDIQIHGALS